jgi:hypothetical protein
MQQWLRSLLIAGGFFNCIMGAIFFSNTALAAFLRSAEKLEHALFRRTAHLVFPSDPLHQLLIHGFGAAALILGVTLVIAARNPAQYRSFIFVDAAGRILFGSLMFYYTFTFDLARVVALFAGVELFFGASYALLQTKKGMLKASPPLTRQR